MTRVRDILRGTVEASTRFSSWLSVPTVLFLAAAGPFVWGLHLVYEPLAWLIPSGAVLGLALWQARAFLVGGRQRGGNR